LTTIADGLPFFFGELTTAAAGVEVAFKKYLRVY
jgi:hypothetical protein